jgi:acyl carrier protein
VLAPKVQGGWLLDRLTRCDPLDWFVMFSSVASVLGSAGQINYSAANAFLDLLARERSTRGLPGLSINWGAWAEIGIAADRGLTDRLAAQGIGAFTASQGLAALAHLLADRTAQVAVLQADWCRFAKHPARGRGQPFLAELIEAAAPASDPAAKPPSLELRDQLNDAPAARRKSIVAGFVRERALRALGADLESPLDPQTPLSELGLDSLLAVELRNTLGRAFQVTLPATLLFDYSTLESLTNYLCNEVLPGEDSDESRAKAPENLRTGSAVLAGITELSDEEVERLLLDAKRSRGAQR